MSSLLKTPPKINEPQNDVLEAWVSASPIKQELANQNAKGIYNSAHQSLSLGQSIGKGGEGAVYEIQGEENLVAKIYHTPPAPEKIAKLIALAKIRDERLTNFSAWPTDVLRDRPDGEVIGFVMKKIGQAAEVHTLHSPKSRLKKFPEASWAFLVHAATNIARAVAAMHEQGFVVGDLNPKNILITKKATVYLLDCDSFQVSIDGKTYRCDAGFPDYTPPELQGVPFRSIDRTAEHDCFGLAVVIFQLLFLGRHPFSGRFLGAGEMPLEKAIGEMRFAYGADATSRQMQQPPGTFQLDALPQELQTLFQRAFLSHDRPNPNEWIVPLEKLAQSLERCTTHSGHVFWRENDTCPWCKIEARARVRLFNFLVGANDEKRDYLQLDEIWREIETLKNETNIAPLESYEYTKLSPTPEAKKSNQYYRLRLITSVVIALLAGVLIAQTLFFPLALLLIFVMSFGFVKGHLLPQLFRAILEIFTGRKSQSQKEKLVETFRNSLADTEQSLKTLEQSWEQGGGDKIFATKIEAFARKKETLESLGELRHTRHRQLEEKLYEIELDKYLRQFAIADHPQAAKKSLGQLQKYYIFTAADLTRQKMRDITKVDEKFLLALMNWRAELVRQFRFDPLQQIPKASRARIETELDELQVRLESELNSAPFYLRQLKTHVDDRNQRMRPEIERQRFLVAQLKQDLEAITKTIPRWPAIILLSFSFLTASFIGEMMRAFRQFDEAPATQAYNRDYEKGKEDDGDYGAFKQEFDNGRAAMEQREWSRAKSHFLSSMPSLTQNYWSDEYTEMYYQLAVARKNLGEIRNFNEGFIASVNSAPNKMHWKLQLAISYMVAGNRTEAKLYYEMISNNAMRDSMRSVLKTHNIKFP